MVADASSVLLFALRASLRLGLQVRQVLAGDLKSRQLALPLPNFPAQLDVFDARAFFTAEGKHHVKAGSRLAALALQAEALQADPAALSSAERIDFLQLYLDCWNADHLGKTAAAADDAEGRTEAAEFLALLSVRQWRAGLEPHPSATQRLAGSLLETAVDWFRAGPGALSPGSQYDTLLRGLLDGLAAVPFSELSPTEVRELPARLLGVVLDSAGELPALLTDDPAARELLRAAGSALYEDVAARLADPGKTSLERRRVADGASLVLRSVLRSAGALAVSDPGKYLGLSGAPRQAMAREVGGALLALTCDRLDGAPWSAPALERVADAALRVAAENPAWATGGASAPLQKLVSQLARDFATLDARRPGLLPEATRLVLLRTSEALPVLWPGAEGDPAANAARGTVRVVLSALAASPPPGATWSFDFSREDLLVVADAALSEMVAHPAWLVSAAGDAHRLLGELVAQLVAVLRLRGGRVLAPATARALLLAALAGASRRLELAAPAGLPKALAAVLLDTLLERALRPGLDSRVAWQLWRERVLENLYVLILEEVSRRVLAEEQRLVGRLAAFLDDRIARLAAGEPWLGDTLRPALSAALDRE